MHLSIPSATFRDILSTAKLALHTRSTLPILESLLFKVHPDGHTLTITSTDLDLTLVQTILLEAQAGPGEACIPFRQLAAIRPDKNTPVRIDARLFDPQEDNDAQVLYVSGGFSAKAECTVLDPSQFPPIPTPPPEDYSCLLPSKTIAAISTALIAASTDQTRYVLNGVFLSPQNGGAIVATDGRRLIKMRGKATPAECILPTRLCQLLDKLKPGAVSCAVQSEPNQWKQAPQGTAISMRLSPGITVHSKLVEGNYPNYQQVIPSDATSSITFTDPAAVATWLSRLPKPTKSDHVILQPRAPHFVDLIHASGSITTTAHLADEPPSIAFNPGFMADCLTAIGGTLYLIDCMSPGTFRNPSGLAVLMPMKMHVDEQAPAPAEEAAPVEVAA